jgi:NAD(P)-dependent dehydrogenase (short-subunit alcohol dehydrogenase family)
LDLTGGAAIVTGGAHGIGRALAQRLHAEGARVAIFDIEADAARETAAGLDGSLAIEVDVTQEASVVSAVEQVVAAFGPIDVYISNAGIRAGEGLGDDADWALSWSINTLSHLFGARAVLPSMAERGRGHFVVTASAGGLLMLTKSAHYTATKHAGIALAEWLAVTYGDRGVGVHCLAPGAVRTRMAGIDPKGFQEATAGRGHFAEPDEVADSVIDAMRTGQFLILSHPETHEYETAKVADRTVWLSKMRAAARRTRRA